LSSAKAAWIGVKSIGLSHNKVGLNDIGDVLTTTTADNYLLVPSFSY